MPKIRYISVNIGADRLATIERANSIIDEYVAAGFDLTLRQLYYQFVSRGLIANSQKEYKRLGDIVNDGRLAGLIDWERITDRTRNLRSLSHWDDGKDIVEVAANNFHVDYWEGQKVRPEVWIEKDALVGVIEGICHELDVPHFSCRGYTSQSEMWNAAQRLIYYRRKKNAASLIIHLGDHDPSGIDMSRDIEDRIRLFMGEYASAFMIHRIALNMDQVTQYGPPPNPAKLTDTRANAYIDAFGGESWELDALDPKVIVTLIRDTVKKLINKKVWKERVEYEQTVKTQLGTIAERWDDVVEFLE